MDFGKVLSRSWEIIWNNKILWLFGVLAGCGSRGGGTSSLQTGSNFSGGGSSTGDLPPGFDRLFNQWGQYFNRNAELLVPIFISLVLLGFVLSIVYFVFRTYGRIALTQGVVLAETEGSEISFSSINEATLPFMWRLLALNFGVGLALAVIFSAIAVLGVLTAGLLFLCLLPLICIMLPLAWVFGVYLRQSNIALVVEDLDIGSALRRGWEVVRSNFGDTIVMGLILWVISLVVAIIIAIPSFIIFGGFFAFLFNSANTADEIISRLLPLGIVIIAISPFFAFVQGVLESYVHSGWTLTYLQFTQSDEEYEEVEDEEEDEPPMLDDETVVEPD